jgi:hypothetical protein
LRLSDVISIELAITVSSSALLSASMYFTTRGMMLL